jgi:hypothetical protein
MVKAVVYESEMNESDRMVVRRNLRNQAIPSLAITLLIFLIILVFSGLNHSFGFLFILLTGFAIFSGIVAFLLLTKKYRSDLKINKVKYEELRVDEKNHRIDYEPGSASMPVNTLSVLFPKIYNRAMKEVHIYEIILNGESFHIKEEEYEMIREGANVFIKRAFNSNLFLRIMAGSKNEN